MKIAPHTLTDANCETLTFAIIALDEVIQFCMTNRELLKASTSARQLLFDIYNSQQFAVAGS